MSLIARICGTPKLLFEEKRMVSTYIEKKWSPLLLTKIGFCLFVWWLLLAAGIGDGSLDSWWGCTCFACDYHVKYRINKGQ
ncbi:hypothetical protein L6452_34037 [Arctium lappa]|uniref:Uncharacterized protein n=1 Tax=Arctium lappa TaxID=4217 RepID=A0ACB8YHS3_ARCLA|nr:hypothetical protein L6452_34037 [Arctium lappa]